MVDLRISRYPGISQYPAVSRGIPRYLAADTVKKIVQTRDVRSFIDRLILTRDCAAGLVGVGPGTPYTVRETKNMG